MKLLHYRNLMEPGGPEFTKAEVKAIIADKEVPAEPNDEGATHADDGSRLMRKALLTDHFVSPYPNDKAAMAANGGALPPDLSVMAKARGIPHPGGEETAGNPFSALFEGVKEYMGFIFGSLGKLGTQYQEAGPDYIYALMMGFEEEVPAGKTIPEGKNFNWVFPGNAISMPPQISDEMVEYADGTKPTADQHARDIAAFLMWAAEPHLNARKRLGLKVLIYLLILSALMYAVKRTIWSGVKH
jgi:ubiquinol-cytochrome c reductase cytochrome b/c1 subunit